MNLHKLERIRQAALNCCKEHQARIYIKSIQFCEKYAEPGYADPEQGIAFGNWNVISRYIPETREFETLDSTPQRLSKIYEKMGVEIEWGDEWSFCTECGGAVRTSPDSYDWTPNYTDFDGYLVCKDCINEEEYLESLEGKPEKCNMLVDNPSNYGYLLLEEGLERGLHPGQRACPTTIAKELKKLGVSRFLFSMDSMGQFDCTFSVWVHKDTQIDLAAWEACPKEGKDLSEGLRLALLSADLLKNDLQKGDIQIHTLNVEEGTCSTKTISPQDFLEGKYHGTQ